MTLLEQCQKWFNEGEVDKIEETVLNLTDEEKTPELISELGRVWIYRSAEAEKEEICCRKALEILEPLEQQLSDNHNYQYRMGMAYQGVQDFEKAKSYFERALALRPGDEDTIEMIEFCEGVMNGPDLNFWEKFSVMSGICPKGQPFISEQSLKKRIASLDDVKLIESEYSDDDDIVQFKVMYQNDEYDFRAFMDSFDSNVILELQKMYFTKDDEKKISETDTVFTLCMDINKKPLESVHLQIKLLYALVPNMFGIYAESQECLLNKREVAMAAESKVGLRPMDLYRVQAIKREDGDLWLHTHGLMPLGLTELEILGVDEEHVDMMLGLINSVASQMIENCYDENDEDYTFFVGNCTEGEPIVATVVPWISGIMEYEENDVQGLEADREESHNTYTSLIFLYKNKEDYDNEILTKPMEFAHRIGDNPLLIYGTMTTEIISMLARERLPYLEKALKLQNSDLKAEINVIAKIAVDVIDDEGEKTVEHAWFKIDRVTSEEISGILTQELFGNGDIVEGERGTYPLAKLTDWIIFFDGAFIDPRVAYLLDMILEEAEK